MNTAPESVLVVGGGLAGFHTASALRRAGYAGALTVLGAEPHPAYDRPPLSKAYLTGTIGVTDLALDDPDDPLDAEWVRGACAASLDPYSRAVRTEDGRAYAADVIVLATGSHAARLGPALPGTHVLRTLDDAEALRGDGVARRRVAVVGGGFVALEAAAAAVALGAGAVTVVSPESHPLRRAFGPEVAQSLKALHERNGVGFVDGARATGFVADPSGRVGGVALADGTVVAADLAIAGVGAAPATGWLASSGVSLGPTGAVLCDASGWTGIDGVWAVGDCAQWHPEAFGVADLFARPSAARRSGHWQDAVDHAAATAATILGHEPPPTPVPYCWSEQHGVTIQVAGQPVGDEHVTVRAGSIAGGDLLVTYERDGEETAVLGMNRPREVTRWRRSRVHRRPAPASDEPAVPCEPAVSDGPAHCALPQKENAA
jgi:NADPH-dependent 2,4-dienoyl-CoA reductase/sulfur reductase-like enzyme